MRVGDLKLKDDVLPFFNYTNNKNSASCLLSLLKKVPGTEAEVQERQAITQGMLDNWHILEDFTYRRLDLIEVNALFEDILRKRFIEDDGTIFSSLKLRLFDTERNRMESRLVQSILLFSDIQRKYLSRINKNKFPQSFIKQLQNALSFLNKLRLEKHAELIKEDHFTISVIVAYSQLLNQLEAKEIKSFWEFFFTFESYWSIAKGTLANNFSFPSFSNDRFMVEDFYHPAVENPIKNTLALDARENVLLLTGPNMSGKSTLLKAISLCVYLSHAGFAVPASTCVTPHFDSIAIAINLSDSLRDGYSHFMAEIENLKAVIWAAESPKKCFAVFDEIFRGTNVDDALDITQTTVNGLAKSKGSFFFISTHMLQLEEQLGSKSNESIKKYYIECVLDNDVPRFSYKLKEGWSQLKIGRLLFEKEGLAALLGR